MKEDVKDKWIEALRSGKYKQGNQVLKSKSGHFCCLGVLCDISGLSEWKLEGKDSPFEIYFNSNALLPEPVRTWAGLYNIFGRFHTNAPLESLATLNDDGLPFEQIADLIEEFWEEL
jgi:hypothetical protein